jgi:hypothetical protein
MTHPASGGRDRKRGGTRRHGLDRYAYHPDMIVDSIDELDYVGLLERFTSRGMSPRYPANDGALRAFAQPAG